MSRLAALLTALATLVVSMGAGLVAGPERQQLGTARSGDHDLGRRVSAALGSGAGFRSLVVAEVTTDDIVWAGLGNADDGRDPGTAPTADRRYELGSITKTFTAALFADAIERGEVRADDRLARHLPELADTPAGDVTLESLAQHRSGLPALGTTVQIGLLAALLNRNPYRTTDVAQLVTDAQVAEVDPTQPPTYSNFAVSLLGTALVRATGASDYPTLVGERITGPLGMTQTSFPATDSEIPVEAVTGFGVNGSVAARWTGSGYLPSGSSTFTSINDLARWAQAQLAGTAPGRAALEPTAEFAGEDRIGWAWITSPIGNGRAMVWHNGGTGGFRTMLALDRDSGRAVVVMGNTTRSVDELAISLLYGNPSGQPLATAPGVSGWVVAGAALLLGLSAVWRALRRRPVIAVASGVLGGAFGLLLLWLRGPWEQVGGWVWGLVAAPTALAVVFTLIQLVRSEVRPLPERRVGLAVAGAVVSLVLVVATAVFVR